MKTIFWFRRDLRIDDNRGFFEMARVSDEFSPIFIFDDIFFDKDDSRLSFVLGALLALKKKLPSLQIFFGNQERIFIDIFSKHKFDAIFTNRAYSTIGQEKSRNVKKIAEEFGVKFLDYNDSLLVDIAIIKPLKVFSPFFRHWQNYIEDGKYIVEKIPKSFKIDIDERYPDILPSYSNFDYINNFDFDSYENNRNLLYIGGVSKISKHIRFGTISIREIYRLSNRSSSYVSELAWREFWYHIAYNFPYSLTTEFQEKRRGIKWQNNLKHFDAWCNAKTGYPIVDAAMRELNTTNYMHGRARMVVASFLTKDLLIDWRLGEKYFANKLIDYDEFVNIGNWQWSASVGADPKPMRIFNPSIQAKKFDPDSIYIKKFLPELDRYTSKEIENLQLYSYTPPIVEHSTNSKLAKQLYIFELITEDLCHRD